ADTEVGQCPRSNAAKTSATATGGSGERHSREFGCNYSDRLLERPDDNDAPDLAA
ncbi:MAG: hypothetical protein ACI9MR_003399, partial [Myxococcota bacterium]